MEPRIQYAKTSDGVSIAFWTMGEGSALVSTAPLAFSHIQLEWRDPVVRRWLAALGEGRRLIRYDPRGFGLSQRNVAAHSRAAYVLDAEAVVDHLGLESFAMMASGGPCQTAMMVAAHLPERLSHLVLWSPFRGFPIPDVIERMIEKDWDLFAETYAHTIFGWSRRESHYLANFMRESTTPQDFAALLRVARETLDAQWLADVRCPTLVMQPRRAQGLAVDAEAATEIAAAIPNSQLMFVETKEVVPFLEQPEVVVQAIDNFLTGSSSARTQVDAPAASALVTILFTDIASSTALTQRLGDAKAQELVRAHNTIVREALKAHGGAEIKHTGDGIMASCPTASAALECAVAVQRAVAARGDTNLQVHIGVNAGEPVAEESDLFGTAVQLARRICDYASAGQILASNVVRELAAGKGFPFADIGEVVPKGFEEPVRLYEVRWRAVSDS